MGKETEMNKSPRLESWVKEFINLNQIYENKLKRISSLASSTRMVLSFKEIAQTLGDCNLSVNPDKYLGKDVVNVTNHTSGIIIALKQVGSILLAGVEFDDPVEGGHALSFRDIGILGRDNYCLWTSFEELRMVK